MRSYTGNAGGEAQLDQAADEHSYTADHDSHGHNVRWHVCGTQFVQQVR